MKHLLTISLLLLSFNSYALDIEIGIGANFNKYEGFNTQRQDNPVGFVILSHSLQNNLNLKWIHASEINDGFNHTLEDRDYVGVFYKLSIN